MSLKPHPGKTCFITVCPKFSWCTVTLCHWIAPRLANSFGSSLSKGLLLFRIPPVPTENMVTVLPLLSFFCNGACPACPTNIAYTAPNKNPSHSFGSKQNYQVKTKKYEVSSCTCFWLYFPPYYSKLIIYFF